MKTFKQTDINLDSYKYIIENDGISVISRRFLSVTKSFIPFENIGKEIIWEKERKLGWLIISAFFLILTLAVFYKRLSGSGHVGDTAEILWLTLSLVFYIIFAFKRKNNMFLLNVDKKNGIKFIGIKIYKKRLNHFIEELIQQRDQYLSVKYPTFEGLTIDENIFCINAEIKPCDGLFLKKQTKLPLEQMIFENEYSEIKKPYGIKSLTTEQNAKKILKEYQNKLISEGKYIFINKFSGNDYYLGLIGNIDDPYKIMEFAETNGINYDLETKDIIKKCKHWDKEFGIQLIGIGFDFCAFEIKNKNINYTKLAAEVYEFCPDIVEQGTETVEALESEIKKEGTIFLWWD